MNKKYILMDHYDNTSKIVSEKDLRNIYYMTLEEIEWNWKDCNDKDILDGFKKEKKEVYTTSIENVIKRIEEDNWFYKVKENK